MDSGPGISLFEPNSLKLNINSLPEEDEEDVEEQRRRNEVLKAQLEHAFDDWSEDDVNDDDHGSSGSSNEGEWQNPQHSSNPKKPKDVVFHNLSNISEQSPSKSGYSLEVSKDCGSGGLIGDSIEIQSPRSTSFRFIQTNVKTPALDGRGDENKQFQPVLIKNLSADGSGCFQPTSASNSFMEISQNIISDRDGAFRLAEYSGVEQLKVLYEVRLREIQRLTTQLEVERENAESNKQEMSRKLALMEAEKERAILSRSEANKLLVNSKEEIDKLQKQVLSQKQIISELEKDKSKSDESAELSKMQIQELEHRIYLLERFDPNSQNLKQAEIDISDLKNKYLKEASGLHREIDVLAKKLQKKEEDCRQLEQKTIELQRAQELLLVEKSETINKLAQQLEESQAQCSQLMSSNLTLENTRLQNQLKEAVSEKQELTQTIQNLQVECKMLRSDLTNYESLTRLNFPQSNSSSDETDSIVQMGISSRQSKHSNLNFSDNALKLKEELHRALLNQKAKRTEILHLQETLKVKEKQIENMTEKEKVYMAETESLKTQLNKMQDEIASIRNKEKQLNISKDKPEDTSILKAEIAELHKEKNVIEKENRVLQQKLDDLTKRFSEEKIREISDHNKEYLKFHDETVAKIKKEVEEEASLKIKEYSIRLEQSLKEISELKEMYVSICAAKEQVVHSLNEKSALLQQITEERDKLAAELSENKQILDQLARQVNKISADNVSNSKLDVNEQPKDFEKSTELRNHLTKRINNLEIDNNKLSVEVERLKAELEEKLSLNVGNQECADCEKLRGELAAMSSRHTQELSSARIELQAARDRLLQLEKCARLQFETEIKTLQQDRDMLKIKCDEKEVQIKKLIESRKRGSAVHSVFTQTEWLKESAEFREDELRRLEERHRQELARCREEYHNTLDIMEQAHQQALISARNRSNDDIKRLQEKHNQILETMQQQLQNQETLLKTAHKQELLEVEERTKQLTVEYFAEEVKRLEAKYLEEACRRPDPSLVESLEKTLQEKSREIMSMKQKFEMANDEYRQKLTALQNQIDADRESTSQVMVHWAQEIKNVQGELKLKEAIIDDQRSKLEKAISEAKKCRNKLKKTNCEIESQYHQKCNEYRANFMEMISEDERRVNERVKQIEQIYKNREKNLIKKFKKIHKIT